MAFGARWLLESVGVVLELHTRDLLLVTHGEFLLSQSPHYCTHRLGRELRNFRSGICVSKSVPTPVDLPG